LSELEEPQPEELAVDDLPVLSVEDVTVRFGGVQAVSSANITAYAGHITGLIGPNGAGKTTTFNVITGLEKPTSGRILVGGRDVGRLPPYRRARLGMARTFQRLEVFGSLSAQENVLAAAEFRRSWSGDKSDPRKATDEIIDRVGLRAVAAMRVESLPTGLARLVELGRALATRPRLLLLDEPGSGLDNTETEALGDLLLDLAAEGMAILLVEHDVDLVMRICDRIHVLDFGKIISVGTTAEVQADPVVQAAYLGADVEGAA
jgi:branched-chain amino acid transport system ATP-binding protein